MTSIRPIRLAAALLLLGSPVFAQEPNLEDGLRVVRLQAEPATIVMDAGRTVSFRVTALDAAGRPVNAFIRTTGSRTALRVGEGEVTGLAAGEHQMVATVVLPGNATAAPATLTIPVNVRWPAVSRVEIQPSPGSLYLGTTLAHGAAAFHADATRRPDVVFNWSSSDPSVATVDRFGNVTALRVGSVTITASFDGVRATASHTIGAFPAARFELFGGVDEARTGDVVSLQTRFTAASGRAVEDVPVTWSYTYLPDDSIAAPGAAGVVVDGKFVGNHPGVYTILAQAGPLNARHSIDVRPRDVVQEVKLLGQGSINHVHTSDLWMFEGRDGRDYALVGTWGGDGWAYMFDVTDPTNLVKTDSVRIDARTINDVVVAPGGLWGALSREGASNRRNGVVILDLADPAHPTVASVYDEDLTGGVHNMHALEHHLFALSGGDKYVILDLTDIRNPRYLSEYDHPDSRIHDVEVLDGIAYSSEWESGVVMVDVGNGRWGGSLEKPVFIGSYATTSGATHEVYPYVQKSTGKRYVFLGDEVMNRRGRAWAGTDVDLNTPGGVPQTMAGYIHILDVDDLENPKNVARYHIEEFGTHDIWVEDDKLIQAYYDGGLRILDISGELLGNLAEQRREIAVFKPFDPQGFTANAPMVMNAQYYKGNIFLTDFNSGLWSVKLEPKPERKPTT